MKVLWVVAHPERRSLTGTLWEEGTRALEEEGHEVRVSDLYGMNWKAVVDEGDFAEEAGSGRRLFVGRAQERAFRGGGLSDDVRAEQEKVRWADVVVFHFPMWWFGPPAILKGWFDRVLTQGFAFGVADDDGGVRRYGDGGLAGKRAWVVTSVGARASGFGARGVHGEMEEVLFPLLHGTFWYTGMEALPPFVVYGADRCDARGYARTVGELRRRVRELAGMSPLAYRPERGGEYDDALVLRDDLAPGRCGVGVHRRDSR
ncbi:NAD(P)H-dependent oxidoreductase [Streptomyces sp. Q6]|uniref:NAD(P)H-dependent oxidoreductase n=1 Tax=Streptomyces citrinus TaxID=3118173 RepID=A0ACD5AHC2_9ACTN